ncbi:MAG: P-loop NTPase [Nitrospinota bacterium]
MPKRYRDIVGDGGSGILGQVQSMQEALARRLASIRWTVAVMSGKGGVGKTTLTANLAVALAEMGLAVGALDADINGPALAKVLGVREQRLGLSAEGVRPAEGPLGVRVVSMDLLLSRDDAPVVWDAPTQADAHVWRANMEVGALREFLADTEWGKLDLLLLDLPPGSDRLSHVTSLLPGLSGALVVTIPSDVSLIVVRRSLSLARELGVRLLGVVENMVGYRCPDCARIQPLFPPERGVEGLAREAGVPYLGGLPFDPVVAALSDAGRPAFLAEGAEHLRLLYGQVARELVRLLENPPGR